MDGLVLPAVAALLFGNALLLWLSTGETRTAGSDVSTAPLLALCWVAVALNGLHNFSHRGTDEVVRSLDTQTAIELLILGLVGAFAIMVLRTGMAVPRMSLSLGLLPVWLFASAAWASAPAYALARGGELGAMALLAAATAGYCANSPGATEAFFRRLARDFVIATTVLVFAGIAIGPLFVKASEANLDRFTWIAAHPVNAGYLLGFSMVILMTVPSESLGFARRTHLALAGVLGVAIYFNQTRTVALAIAGCGVAMLVRAIRQRSELATVGTLALVILGIVGAGAVGSFVLRGGDTDELWTLNGRTDLWDVAYEHLHGAGEWAIGLGYGTSRVLFVEDFSFATNAHNSLLSALVDAGLIGAALLLTITFGTAVRAVQVVRSTDSVLGPGMVGLALYLVAVGATSDLLMTPGLGTTGVYSVAAMVAAITTRSRALGNWGTASADGFAVSSTADAKHPSTR